MLRQFHFLVLSASTQWCLFHGRHVFIYLFEVTRFTGRTVTTTQHIAKAGGSHETIGVDPIMGQSVMPSQ
jgi:hypothetical protein